jgi:hypothetical protein
LRTKFQQTLLQGRIGKLNPFLFLRDDFFCVGFQQFQNFCAPLIFADEAVDDRIQSSERAHRHTVITATIILRGDREHQI